MTETLELTTMLWCWRRKHLRDMLRFWSTRTMNLPESSRCLFKLMRFWEASLTERLVWTISLTKSQVIMKESDRKSIMWDQSQDQDPKSTRGQDLHKFTRELSMTKSMLQAPSDPQPEEILEPLLQQRSMDQTLKRTIYQFPLSSKVQMDIPADSKLKPKKRELMIERHSPFVVLAHL